MSDVDRPELPSDDLDLTGTQWEKFAHVSNSPNLGNDFGQMAYAFERAAEVLFGQWESGRGHNLEIPIAYLCRHRLELSIKSAWEEACGIGFDEGTPPRDHNLTRLWMPVQEFCESKGILHAEDNYVAQFRDILAFLDELDARSTAFRYPLDDRANHISVDVPRLWRAMDLCDTIFFGLDAMMDQYSDYLSEMYCNEH